MPLNFATKVACLLGYVVFLDASDRVSAGSHEIPFLLKDSGYVSAAIYDNQGKMLRELAHGMKLQPGQHHFFWDGLDRYGKPAPAGEYEWRLLRTPGFTREFLVNVGTNPGWAPFDLWPGNHNGPTRLMIDADMNLYIGALSSEGPPHILKMSRDGRQKFWDTGTWGLANWLIGMARVGEVVDVLFRDGTLDVLSAETGAKFWGHQKPREILDLMRRAGFIPSNHPQARKPDDRMRLADLIHPNDPEARKDPRDRQNVSEMALAAGSDFLVVTYQKYDDVRFFRAQDDVVTLTKSVRVPEPKGCCVAPDGRVFVVSGRSVVRVDPATGEVKPIVLDPELVSPTRIAYDSNNNDLLVIQHSDRFDHVRRYQAADGRLIAVYGRLAGRTYGNFNPLDWGGLLDIVTDGEGGFFTVEEFPRRVAHFRGREHHELVAQWFGGMQWGALCSLDPADPTIVYLFPDHKHCARGRIDYATRTWTLTHLYALPEGFSWFLGKERHRAMFPNFGGMSYWEVRHVGDATFLVNTGRTQGGCAAVVRVDEKQNRLVPVSFAGGLHPSLDRTDPPSWWLEAMKRAGYDPAKTGYGHFCFSWSDTNRNGKIDAEEVKLGSLGNTWSDAHCFIDPGWNIYYALANPLLRVGNRFQKVATKAPDHSAWFVIPNEGRSDLPIWNWDHARPSVATYPQGESALGATMPLGILHATDGSTYMVCNAKVDLNKADLPPSTWPNNTTFSSRFEKWNSAGTLEWSVGLHTAAKDRPPGQFSQVRGILGVVNDCLVVLDACEPASVWTRDGLYAGSLYSQRVNDGLPDLAYSRIFGDDHHWGFVLQLPQGEVLWGAMSDASTPFYRIRGWEKWERQSGKLTVKYPTTGALWKGSGLRAEYFTNMNLSGKPALRRTDPDIWFGPMWGAFRQVPAPRIPWFSDAERSILTASQFSARWQGFIEAPLSENFNFAIYTYGRSRDNDVSGSKVRLWVNGELVINEWDGVKQQEVAEGQSRTRACLSRPIALSAGQLVPIRIEYDAAGGDEAHLHLFFGSDSIDLRHVPHGLMYDKAPNHKSN